MKDDEEKPVALICEQHGPVGSTRWFGGDPKRAVENFAKLHLIKESIKHPLTGPVCDFKLAEVDDVAE